MDPVILYMASWDPLHEPPATTITTAGTVDVGDTGWLIERSIRAMLEEVIERLDRIENIMLPEDHLQNEASGAD